jgi:predicted negative regulator of RcsB-dependent stress response
MHNGDVPRPHRAGNGSATVGADGRSEVAGDRPPGRYPARRRSTKMLVIVLAAILIVGGLGWLGWAAWQHSHPAVSGRISRWKVQSDQKVRFTLTVDRRDAHQPATCRVIAQASSYENVGELNVAVPPTKADVVDIEKTMRTLHRATSVSLDQCRS